MFLLNPTSACTELEMVTMDWLGSALNLPKARRNFCVIIYNSWKPFIIFVLLSVIINSFIHIVSSYSHFSLFSFQWTFWKYNFHFFYITIIISLPLPSTNYRCFSHYIFCSKWFIYFLHICNIFIHELGSGSNTRPLMEIEYKIQYTNTLT